MVKISEGGILTAFFYDANASPGLQHYKNGQATLWPAHLIIN